MKQRYLGLAVAILAIAALTIIACGENTDTGTSPALPVATSSTTTSTGQPAGQPAAEQPEAPAADPGHPEVIYQGGKFVILNPTNHGVTYRMCTFQISDPYTIHRQGYLGQTDNVTASKNTNNTVIPWSLSDFDLKCGLKITVQVDPWKGGTDCPKDAYSIDERGTFLRDLSTGDCGCDDYEAPVISGNLGVVPGSTSYTFNKGTIAPNGGTFNPTLPQTVARPDYGHPAGSFSTMYTLSYGPAALQCSVSKTFTEAVPPKDASCDDFTPPKMGGELALTDQTATQVTVTRGNILPAGGTFNPTLPAVQSRPAIGQPDRTFSTTHSVLYGPVELQCVASKDYSVAIPSQECVPEWTELDPEITYGEWSECLPEGQDAANIVIPSCKPTCSQSRTVRTIIREQNSCTQEVRVKSDTTTTERRPCECPATCESVPASSSAAQNFGLPDSSDATETNWVNDNVNPGPYELYAKPDNFQHSCTTANFSAKVVLLKAGTKYWYFLNVTPGKWLCSGNLKDISHLSKFRCRD